MEAAGADGAAATIAAGTVTTGAVGSSATVTNSGSSSAATFDFRFREEQPALLVQLAPPALKDLQVLMVLMVLPTSMRCLMLSPTTVA